MLDRRTYSQIRVDDLFAKACETGNLEEVIKIFNENPQINLTFDDNLIFVTLCANNHLEIAKYIMSIDDTLNPINIIVNNLEPFRICACNGHYTMTKWLYNEMITRFDETIINQMIIKNNNEIFRLVCKNNRIDIARWLIEIIPTINPAANEYESFRWACCNGDLEMVQWLYGITPDLNISMFNNYILRYLCKFGHLSIIQWLLNLENQNVDISAKSDEAMKSSCEYGHLAIAKLLYEEKIKQNQEYTDEDMMLFFDISLFHGNLTIAKWIWEKTDDGKNLDISDYVNQYILGNAFKHICDTNYITTAKWLYEKIPNIGRNVEITNIFKNVCKKGHQDMVIWLYENFKNINITENNDYIFKTTCINGHLDIAKWMYEIYKKSGFNYLNTDRYTLLFKDVCANGHIKTAQWIFELDNSINITVFNNRAFNSACLNGHVTVVDWLYKILAEKNHELMMDLKHIFINVCSNGHFEMLEWLHDKYTEDLIPVINEMMGYIFVITCSKGYEKISKWLYRLYRANTIKYINMHQFNEAFTKAVSNGHKHIVEWLYFSNPSIDIDYNHNEGFLNAVKNGYYDIVLLLYTINNNLDVTINDNEAFVTACFNNEVDIAQLLYYITPIDISANNDYIFRKLCKDNILEVAIWFETLLPERYKLFFDDYGDIEDFNINRTFILNDNFVRKDVTDEICPICLTTQPNIITDCKHIFCKDCITILYEKGRDECCLCRNEIKEYNIIIHPRVYILDI